jgi:Arc/MetJ-type ribon-helix-helix transcriptional regulator/predicted aspartyl protease
MIPLVLLMTLLNIKIDKKKKEHIKEMIKDSEYKSISDFVRNVIDEKIKILESKKQIEEIEVPDWIPDGKYYAIVKGAIVAVGDSPSSIAQEIAFKFPFEKIIIDRKNKEIPELEYAYSSHITDLNCWSYFKVHNISYPTFPITLIGNDHRENLMVIPDTAASLTLIKKEIIEKLDLSPIDIQELQTALGISKVPIYELNFEFLSQIIPSKVISAPISDIFPFQGMIGRNVLDLFNLYLFGREQVICIK